MKKSKVIYRIFPALLLFTFFALNGFGAGPEKQQYYEIKIYRIADKIQEGKVDVYLKDAYLPALHRAGIPIVGVFKPVEADTAFGKLIYVLIPFKTVDQFIRLPEHCRKINYLQTPGNPLAMLHLTSHLIRGMRVYFEGFHEFPQFVAPKYSNSPSERIYELRSYESATDTKAIKRLKCSTRAERLISSKNLSSILSSGVKYC